MAKYEIAVDLGSSNITVFQKGAGLVLREPAVVAGVRQKNKFDATAIGLSAKNLLTRELGDSRIVFPIKEGVVADVEVAAILIKNLLSKIIKENALTRTVRAVVLVSSALTEMERSDVEKTFNRAGVKDVTLESPLSLIAHSDDIGALFVDIGGGKTEIASVTRHGIASAYAVNIAGNAFNKAIISLAESKYCVKIGEYTAERLKIGHASFYNNDKGEAEITGRSLLDGSPKTVTMLSSDIRQALNPAVDYLVEVVEAVLSATPPELTAEIGRKGIYLSGASCVIPGLKEYFSARLNGLPVSLVDEPENAVAIGGGKLLSDRALLASLLGVKNI